MYKTLPKEYRRKVYLLWYNMLRRCLDTKNKDYKYYGAKGVVVCDRWLQLDNFATDIATISGWSASLFTEGLLQLDKDVKKSKIYSVDTCCFIDSTLNKQVKPSQQEDYMAFSPSGACFEFRNQTQFAKEHKLHQGCISDCIKEKLVQHKGWVFKLKPDNMDNR